MDEDITICTVDIAGYGDMDRTRPNYVAMRAGMYESVRRAFAESAIPWEACFIQDLGDSILALAPSDIPKGAFAGKLPEALVTALEEHNAVHPVEEKIKLRLALHAGEVTVDRYGAASSAATLACRLLDAQPLKDNLAGSNGNLAVIVSDWFFTDVIRHHVEYAPEAYRKTKIGVKEFDGAGWIRLPDGVLPEDPREGVPVVVQHEAPAFRHVPRLRPASPVFYELVDALEDIPCMQEEQARRQVVDQLRFAEMVRYFASRRAHITSILRTCLDFEDGLKDLVTAISEQEKGESIPVKRLVAMLSTAETTPGTMPLPREPEPFTATGPLATSRPAEPHGGRSNNLEHPPPRLPRTLRNVARDHIGSEVDDARLPIDADARLLGAPAVTAIEVRRRGVDPDLHGLIRLWSEQAVVRLPSFQFTPTGEARPLVLEINILLGVAEDPWGVADWWLSPNTWLTGVPADLLDNVEENRLRAAAIAAVEG